MLNQQLKRRRLLQAGMVGGIGLLAAACSPQADNGARLVS